jgi:hypothetical protein
MPSIVLLAIIFHALVTLALSLLALHCGKKAGYDRGYADGVMIRKPESEND